MYVDDLGRMLGWEFSLMAATVRIINSGLLDQLPTLKIQFSHFAGGIGRALPGGRTGRNTAPPAFRVMAASRGSCSTTTFGSDCFTIVAGGLVPIARPSAAPTGCAWGSRSCRRHHKLSLRPTIPRPWKT